MKKKLRKGDKCTLIGALPYDNQIGIVDGTTVIVNEDERDAGKLIMCKVEGKNGTFPFYSKQLKKWSLFKQIFG